MASPAKVNPILWFCSWTFVFISWSLMIFQVLFWALSSGSTVVQAWGIQLLISLLQEIFISETLSVYLVNIVMLEEMRYQLRQIYHVLHEIATNKLSSRHQRVNSSRIRVVQHLSGKLFATLVILVISCCSFYATTLTAACRVARSSVAKPLPCAQIFSLPTYLKLDSHP